MSSQPTTPTPRGDPTLAALQKNLNSTSAIRRGRTTPESNLPPIETKVFYTDLGPIGYRPNRVRIQNLVPAGSVTLIEP